MSSSPAPTVKPSTQDLPWHVIFRVWFALGLQSFGGGAATLTLIRRELVERRHWIDDGNFSRDWALCQMAPGINLLCITILLGRRIAGAKGIAMSLLGLLLPSVTATILLTAFYAHVRDNPTVKAAVSAVVPASVGLGLYTAYGMAVVPLKESRQDGVALFLTAGVVLVASSVAAYALHLPVVFLLLISGAILAAAKWWHHAATTPAPTEGAS